MVAPPEIVRPPICVPLPIVDDACERRPAIKVVVDAKSAPAKWLVEEAKMPLIANSGEVVAAERVPKLIW